MTEASLPPPDPADPQVRRLVLTARCALTPRSARLFIASVAAATLAVAIFFTLQGFWPVLPFAGLELALLTWAVRASMRSGARRQTITITADSVTVERHDERGERLSVFPRHWVRVKLHAPLAALHPQRLVLESQGRSCEVGEFLTEDERRGLAARLKQLVGNMNESPALS
jgi:uncharacterized membrane protein